MRKFFTAMCTALLVGAMSAEAENVVVKVTDGAGTSVYGDFESELVKNDDGSWALLDFFNSGCPVSFTFEPATSGNWADMYFCGDIDDSVDYPYLLTPDGEYMMCYATPLDADDDEYVAIWWPYVANAPYSAVYTYIEGEADYDYYAWICMGGTPEGGVGDWYYLIFKFNEPILSGVDGVSVGFEAPVEYYNLNGVRIDNPSNGIFVRRQGSDVRKVVVD